MKWTIDQANDWYEDLPFLFGANFNPSTAINQLEMWQEDSFDPETIQRELSWAQGIGMNVMRVYLHDLLWEQDSEGFCQRLDRYLDIADSLGIKTLFVLFDDCWNQKFALGKQPKPKPYTHNSGWIQSPGVSVVNDSSQWRRLETYTVELLTRFKTDERILGWDLYNEPGNGKAGDDAVTDEMQIDGSLPLLTEVFNWARSVEGLIQPITVGVWNFDEKFDNLNAFSLSHSDVNSFHCYLPPHQLVERIKRLGDHKRPLLCTEYMARGNGSTFAYNLPVLKKHNIAAINWGLVAGKSQTIYPWKWTEEKGEPDVYFHDLFWPDGSFLYPFEEQAILQVIEI